MPSIPVPPNDAFTLHNLRVEIDASSGRIIGKHKIGDYFEVVGEDIFIPHQQGFSLYALASLLPLLPAKQRMNHPNDFMETDDLIADPDVHSKAVYRIRRMDKTVFHHGDVSANPLSPPSLS